MKKLFIISVVVSILLLSSLLNAQAVSTSKLAFDIPTSTLAVAQGYAYKYYPDSAVTGTTLATVTCTGTATPFQCEAPFPAFTPGSHTLTITAVLTYVDVNGVSQTLEGAKSTPFTFTFIVNPGTPINLHIK